MEIISKEEATRLSMKYYFTGKPCKRGHLSYRNVKYGVCLECAREKSKEKYHSDESSRISRLEKQKEYRNENKELFAERYKAFYQKNRERLLKQDAEYRANNKEKEAARHKIYRQARLQECLQRERRYRENNKEAVQAKLARRRGMIAAAGDSFKPGDVKKILLLQKGRCAGCGNKIPKYHIDHIKPLSKGGSNSKGNIQLLCQGCNLAKAAKLPEVWANERGLLI